MHRYRLYLMGVLCVTGMFMMHLGLLNIRVGLEVKHLFLFLLFLVGVRLIVNYERLLHGRCPKDKHTCGKDPNHPNLDI